tara:strand:+ start:31840 stop:32142 length:303 start_codon:yes stop_codon:yes gene_type:complete
MTELYERPNKMVEVDGTEYKLVAFPAMQALDYQFKLGAGDINPALVADMVMKGVSKNGVAFNKDSFDKAFTGKISHLMKVWDEVISFNFKDPLDESDSVE